MLRLDQIHIYPIKSCAGIELESSPVHSRGFPLDRRWLLIEKDGKFISQRSTPSLGQIKISSDNDHLLITADGKRALNLQVGGASPSTIKAEIWKDSVEGWWVGQDCDDWFSDVIGREVHLIHMDESVSRPLIKESLPKDQSFEVSFADGYPYLLTTLASLNDLNQRLEVPIPMDRFRSNLVISGSEAFAEDGWRKIAVGEVEFQVVKPCARCQVTTIDQSSGIASKEPLKTLATYRKQDGKVMFGMNMVALSSGTISINDPVKILS